MWQFPCHEAAGPPNKNQSLEDHRNPVLPSPSSQAFVSVRSAARRVAPATTTTGSGGGDRADLLLPNGDLYTGTFAGNLPHGTGKYIWKDGCMYDGEWRRGKAAGKGRFSWPSGATYEGGFRSGHMDGVGTFTGSDGDTYSGNWIADRKHGFGRKRYSNGDFYQGMWRRNLQEGHGRYVWRNGNGYIGEWKNGVVSGRGVLLWANGNRYDGCWENGVPKGNGVFTWADGSCYVWSWSRDLNKQLKGTFYSARNGKELNLRISPLFLPFEENPIRIPSSKRLSSVDWGSSRGSVGDRNLNFPRICIWESDGEAGDITCDIIDNLQASMFYRDGTGLDNGDVGAQNRRCPCCFKGELKKPGQTICKGHKHYDLMRNLQLGISYSVGKSALALQFRDLRPVDFDLREKFWTRFPPEGSKITPPHHSAEFRWKDYCPMVFRHLRKLFAVDPADYMLAICGNDALRELSSPGKSGSFFYLTQDDRFMIKTVKKSEVKVLLKMLPSYYEHVCQYENSLVTKFFGVHCLKPVGGHKVRFIVIGNLFCSEHPIHRRFDLKGSSHGRTTNKSEGEIDENTTLKDLDLNFVFRLPRFWYQDLLRQIERDCEFLEAVGIMDYSLLVGVHCCNDLSAGKMEMSTSMPSSRKEESFQDDKSASDGCFFGEQGLDMDPILSCRKPLIRLGANMPARAETVMRSSNYDQYQPYQSSGGELMPHHGKYVYEVILYFGIIDILQGYNISKKLEHAYKSLHADPTSISAVDPKLYSRRFQDFICRIFREDS